MTNIGFLAALGAALAWGSYIVPFKKSPSSNLIQFQALMTVGVFLFAAVISPILGYSVNFPHIIWHHADRFNYCIVEKSKV